MDRCLSGDKPLFEPMMVSLTMHIYVLCLNESVDWINVLFNANQCSSKQLAKGIIQVEHSGMNVNDVMHKSMNIFLHDRWVSL